MVCRRCGSVQPDTASYCGACGVPIAVADLADTTVVLPPAGPPAGPVAVRRSPRHVKVLASVAAAVVVLAALAAAGWRAHWPAALFGPAHSPAQAAEPPPVNSVGALIAPRPFHAAGSVY